MEHYRDSAFQVRHNATERDGVARRAGIVRRFVESIRASRQDRVDRDIARLIARRGGRITDDLEREMTSRLLTSDWSARG
jgi:hypothetical protein